MKDNETLANIISDNLHACTDMEQDEFFFTLLGVLQVTNPKALVTTAEFVSEKLSEKLQKPLDQTA